jgi:DNA primase
MPKDQTLYDYDATRRTAVIVESPMSVAKHRHALPVEATFGANVTDRQIKLIARHFERCVLWMDNDKAGWNALEGSKDAPGMMERLAPYCPVWVVSSPFSGDPADLDTERAGYLIEDAVPANAWRRPESLACPDCWSAAHSGTCHSVDL